MSRISATLAPSGDDVRDAAVNFGVEGVLHVRTYGARQGDLLAVARDVGPPTDVAAGAPLTTVRFVDEIAHANVRLLDGGTMGYGDEGIFFFPRRSNKPIARVTQGPRWGEASIVCRHGVGRIPLLGAAVDLAALAHGWAPIHGSAWVTPNGVGVLVSGWARSGKTGALLAACESGAAPVGDDRILLSGDGSSMVGLGRPIEVKDWHLAGLRLPALGPRRVRRLLARASTALKIPSARVRRAMSVELDPARLARPSGAIRTATPDVLVILETHRKSSIVWEPADPASVAGRVAAQMHADLAPSLRAQLSFDYAFPGERWTGVDGAPEVAAAIVTRATAGVAAYVVRHPYPCSLAELDGVMSSIAASHRGSRP